MTCRAYRLTRLLLASLITSLGPAAPPSALAAAGQRKPAGIMARTSESITARQPRRPGVQNFPHAGVIGQPRRVTTRQNTPPAGRLGPWGAFTRGNGEAAGFGPVGRYGVEPWAEDWQFLRHHPLSDDPFDPLKFIALNRSGTIWLTLSGETRLRNWYEENPALGQKGTPGSGRFTMRNLYGADLHLGENLRFFGQIVNGTGAGWAAYGYNTTYRKRLDLQQGFAEVKGRAFGAHLGVLLGRQEFLDAPSYVMYNRQTPNVPLSWNGARGYAIWPHLRIDLYDFVQTNTNATRMFHDTEDWGTRLHGLDITFTPGTFHIGGQAVRSYVDLFAMGFRVADSRATMRAGTASLTGSTDRQNGGFRWYGGAPSFEFSIGALYQSGSFESAQTGQQRAVHAYAVNFLSGYRNPQSRWHPFLGLQADLYSGSNTQKTSGGISTYLAPFNPQTNYLDTTTYIAPSNLIAVSPVLRTTPLPFISLRVKMPVMWRASAQDGVYNSSGAYTFQGISGGLIGIVPQASLVIQLGRHLSWTQYGARFIASNEMRQAGARSGSYYQSNLVFRF